MGASPQISVILPTYNRKNYVGGMLSDISKQDYFDFELLIVDDGSTDGTDAVIKKFLEGFSGKQHHLFVRVNHIGLPAKLINYMASEHAQGEYIAFAFDDDRWHSHCLSTLHGAIAGTKFDLVYGQAQSTEEAMRGKVYGRPFDAAELMKKNYIPNLAVLMRRDSFLRSGGYSETWEDRRRCDWYFWQRLAREGYKFGYIPRVVGLWVALPDGINRGGNR